MREPLQVAYIQGRPSGHPTHNAYAKAVGAEFFFVDRVMRYHDRPESSKIRRYLSWVINALFFPNKKKYRVFLSEEAYFMLGIMKRLGLISKEQRLFSLMGSHTLYFLYSGKYGKKTTKAFMRLFPLYDAYFCEGPIQYRLLKEFLGEQSRTKVYKIFNGSAMDRFEKFIQTKPGLDKLNIVTVGALGNNDRIFYKGIDLMLEAFELASADFPELTFTIVGEHDKDQSRSLLQKHCPRSASRVIFTGRINELSVPYSQACLYIHTARGEAWGISVTEAMNCGLPAMVSDWTGSKEVVERVSEELVVPLDAGKIAKKLKWFLGLPLETKKALSEKSRETAMFYNEDNALKNFKETFEKAMKETHP